MATAWAQPIRGVLEVQAPIRLHTVSLSRFLFGNWSLSPRTYLIWRNCGRFHCFSGEIPGEDILMSVIDLDISNFSVVGSVIQI